MIPEDQKNMTTQWSSKTILSVLTFSNLTVRVKKDGHLRGAFFKPHEPRPDQTGPFWGSDEPYLIQLVYVRLKRLLKVIWNKQLVQ